MLGENITWTGKKVTTADGTEVTYNFEHATEADRREILDLYHAQIDTPGCTWREDYPDDVNFEYDLGRDSLFCFRTTDGEIIGVVSIDADEEVEGLALWSPELAPGGELSRLAVKDGYKNLGLAGELLQCAVVELRNRGFKSVHFLVSKTNERALKAYNKLQFENRGETDLFHGNWYCYEQKI